MKYFNEENAQVYKDYTLLSKAIKKQIASISIDGAKQVQVLKPSN